MVSHQWMLRTALGMTVSPNQVIQLNVAVQSLCGIDVVRKQRVGRATFSIRLVLPRGIFVLKNPRFLSPSSIPKAIALFCYMQSNIGRNACLCIG